MASEAGDEMGTREPGAEAVSVRTGVVGVVQAQEATLSASAAGAVIASGSAAVSQGGAAAVIAGGDAAITAGGATVVVAGGNMEVTGGGAAVLIAGGEMEITGGGGALLIAGEAEIERGFVGLVLSGKTELEEGSRVLLGTAQAAALGAALGLAFAIANRGLRRAYVARPVSPEPARGVLPVLGARLSPGVRTVRLRLSPPAVTWSLARQWLGGRRPDR